MKKKRRYNFLVTAGPTVEPLDPVRYLSNFSTGAVGYHIAREAAKRGHRVFLVSGPVRLDAPAGVALEKVLTAAEMKRAVDRELKRADCVIMTAAVCDFRPAKTRKGKIKKGAGKKTLTLVPNPDILAGIKGTRGVVKVGFALETSDLERNARKKMSEKGLDMIVANEKTGAKDPFGEGEKDFTVIGRAFSRRYRKIKKDKFALALVKEVEQLLEGGPWT